MPLFAILCSCLLVSTPALAQEKTDGSWPREIVVPEGTVIVYQPQPDKLEGDILSARTAVAIELKDAKEPVFGVMWADARLETDRSNRTATIVDVKVTELRFPEEDKEKEKKIKALIEREVPKWDHVIDMDRLLTTLEIAEDRLEATEKIETKPPKIVVETGPAELIVIKGEPEYTPITGTELLYVSNTDSDVLMDIASQKHLGAGAAAPAGRPRTGRHSVRPLL